MYAPLAEAAITYADRGFEVFPLQRHTKVPVGGNGHLDATTDTNTVARWWNTHPQSNIGLRIPVGHIVIDVDPRKGGLSTCAKLFDTSVGELSADVARALPIDTSISLSGSQPQRGFHVWFRAHGAVVGSLGDGIDVKSRTGYVVAPPSIHPSGLRYEWVTDHPPAPAPGFLLDVVLKRPTPKLQRTTTNCSKNIDGLVRTVREATEGERNNILFWAACKIAESGNDPAVLLSTALNIGLSEHEAVRTITSAERRVAA